MTSKARVVSGMRPTGRLHIGHLVGALGNWVPLQDQYDCFYFVADWHALTSDYADTSAIRANAVLKECRYFSFCISRIGCNEQRNGKYYPDKNGLIDQE